nr:integrase, catalytic region, zinc finger, CCHC-type, peptidase aspartic, catalytic [Tanacetum cinerariifolium]
KPKKVGTRESLATPKPRKSRLLPRWSPTGRLFNQEGNLKLLINFVWKFMGTVRFGNDHVAAILGQFCDSDLEVAFRRDACFVRNLEGVDLLKRDRSTNLYTINLHEMASASPICLMARSSSTNINGKQYVLVIVDDYSRYTWVHFLRSKDEAPEVIITFLKRITVLLQSPVIIIRTDNGTEFKNQVLKEYFDIVGISHQISSVRTLQQNGVVERRNQTLVEAARTIIYNRRKKKIMETMNVLFDELLAMVFEQRSSKPELQSMTSGQISSGLDLTFAPSTITTQQPSEGELDLLFEAMYDDYIGGQPSLETDLETD